MRRLLAVSFVLLPALARAQATTDPSLTFDKIEALVRMRDGIVKEISDVVMNKVRADNMDLVFDISGVSLNGVPTVMFARPDLDFTTDVITQLNKPASSPAPKAAASPAKPPPTKP